MDPKIRHTIIIGLSIGRVEVAGELRLAPADQ